jgi:hypothetical protein
MQMTTVERGLLLDTLAARLGELMILRNRSTRLSSEYDEEFKLLSKITQDLAYNIEVYDK